jgi:hypothetical protein
LPLLLAQSIFSVPFNRNRSGMPEHSNPRQLFHLDLRIQVMTPRALCALADELAGFGFAGIVLEWEAAFPFKSHPVIPNQYAYTRAEIGAFLRRCKKLGLETIPMQQCFGHLEYILQHDRYAHLREDEKDICQLCPLKVNEAIPLFKDLFRELAEVHDSEFIFIGCDETYLLGKCPACAQKSAKLGKSTLFVDYVKEMCDLVTSLGKRPVIWADMLLAHPEAAGNLPKEIVLVDWNYGWAPDRFGNPEPLLKTGLEMWGAPSLRSGPDSYYLSTWQKHLENFRDFIPYCREKHYSAIVLTSWSTSGIYGFEWEAFYEPIAMHTIRRVYPLAGFRILMSAFAEALRSPRALDPAAFVRAYAVSRFGLTIAESDRFYDALMADASTVYKPAAKFYHPPKPVLESVKKACAAFSALRPKRNRDEFDHFRLMFDIRCNYLSFKVLEESVQAESFRESGKPAAAKQLKALIKQSDALAKRFSAQLKGYLFPSEITAENRFRKKKMELLLDRLVRSR